MLRPLLHQPDIPREGHPRTAVRYFKDIRYYLFYMLQYVKWKHWYMYLKYNIENRSLPVYKNFIMSFQNQTDFFSKYPRYNIVQCLIMKFFLPQEAAWSIWGNQAPGEEPRLPGSPHDLLPAATHAENHAAPSTGGRHLPPAGTGHPQTQVCL